MFCSAAFARLLSWRTQWLPFFAPSCRQVYLSWTRSTRPKDRTVFTVRWPRLACQLPVVPAFLPSILSRPLEGPRVYPGTPAVRCKPPG
ncbi:hypothetical protein MRX96_058595 [Rhipicephalus microplus]